MKGHKNVETASPVPAPSIKPFGGGAKSGNSSVVSGAKPQGTKSNSQPHTGSSKIVGPAKGK